MLAILLQSSQKNRLSFIELDGVDTLLQLLSAYRKRDPEKDSDEEEYVENLFACLTCLVDEDAGKGKFIEGEGIELAQIMLREGKMSKPRALRTLNFALGGRAGRGACERLVEVAGLRIVFGMFMKKVRVSRDYTHMRRHAKVSYYSRITSPLNTCWAYSPLFYDFCPGNQLRGSELWQNSWKRITRKFQN